MTTPLKQEQIRDLAYQLWEREGRPTGRDREHWQQAEDLLELEEPAMMSEATQPETAPFPRDNAVLRRPEPTPGVVKDGLSGRAQRSDADLVKESGKSVVRDGAGTRT